MKSGDSQSSIRDRILSAAFQSLKENGFLGASTPEIATKAHVSKCELYALFPSKDKILFARICDFAADTVRARVSRSGRVSDTALAQLVEAPRLTSAE
jgi:AcrR family transcriptional regulator